MRHLSLLVSALLFSAFAQAASNANITTISCSGSRSFDLTNGALLSCDGDFSLIGGSIDSDTGITISAGGSLFLDDLRLSAPSVGLKTLSGAITIASGTSIDARDWANFDISASPRLTFAQPGLARLERGEVTINAGGDISLGQPGRITLSQGNGLIAQRGDIDLIVANGGGQIVVSGGGNLTLVSSVPEPSMAWSLFAGGLLLALRRTGRKDRA